MSEETITITKAEYIRLRKSDLFLEYLQGGGVDNWEWYDEACREYIAECCRRGWEPEDE